MQGNGGGIRYVGDLSGVVRIQMCRFIDNTAGNDGGGVSIVSSLFSYSVSIESDGTAVTISDSTFSGNSAKVHSACCHTGPFVLSFCMGIVIDGQRLEKMLCYTGDKDPMSACTPCSCCMLYDGP